MLKVLQPVALRVNFTKFTPQDFPVEFFAFVLYFNTKLVWIHKIDLKEKVKTIK